MLRRTRAMVGFTISASDGGLGRVEDFLVEDLTWRIRYLDVETESRWPTAVVSTKRRGWR